MNVGNYPGELVPFWAPGVYTDEKPYTCGDCGRTFSTGCSACLPQRIHTRKKHPDCQESGESLPAGPLLTFSKYQRVHTRRKLMCARNAGKPCPENKSDTAWDNSHRGEALCLWCVWGEPCGPISSQHRRGTPRKNHIGVNIVRKPCALLRSQPAAVVHLESSR